MRITASVLLFAGVLAARTPFWAPVQPPRATYKIEAVADGSRLHGTARISFTNNTKRSMARLQLRWYGDELSLTANGSPAVRVAKDLFELPADLEPGQNVELVATFGAKWPLNPQRQSAVTSFLAPRLFWGFGTHDDYEVRLQVPEGFTVATSGRFDAASGTWRAKGIRTFGLFVAKGHQALEKDAGGVHIRAIFTPKGRECAQLLMDAAVDAVPFYRERFGLYPHQSLTIVPGSDTPQGGYPVASAMVVVHGQERLSARPNTFWRWITAHEIGHEYWSEHVLAKGSDSLDWLLIGLGIQADREYRRARGIDDGTGAQWPKYVEGVKQGLDTTIDISDEKAEAVRWDFNNVVVHGKSAAVFNALESVIGAPVFDKVYRRVLRDYAGKRLGWREFQTACETESGQDLDWFFEQWVRTPNSVNYRVAGNDCIPSSNGFDCTVRVEQTGTMQMSIPVLARFEDGTQERVSTERLAKTEVLRFRSKSRLATVELDPDKTVAMAEPPGGAERELRSKLRELPWSGGSSNSALVLYKETRALKLDDPDVWIKLALSLYDARSYQEVLEAAAELERGETNYRFAGLVWQGHILDLMSRRGEAVARYTEALKVPGSPGMQHGQYKLTINKDWVERRLKDPFTRP